MPGETQTSDSAEQDAREMFLMHLSYTANRRSTSGPRGSGSDAADPLAVLDDGPEKRDSADETADPLAALAGRRGERTRKRDTTRKRRDRSRRLGMIEVGNSEPILLDDADDALVVLRGQVHFFAVRLENGQVAGVRRYLGSVESAHALFGVTRDITQDPIGLLAVGVADTRLLRIERARLAEVARNPEYADHVIALLKQWIVNLSSKITRDMPPRECQPFHADPDGEIELQSGESLYPQRSVLWVQITAGACWLNGEGNVLLIADREWFPMPRRTWLQATVPTTLRVLDTASYIEHDEGWHGLDYFHRTVLNRLVEHMEQAAWEDQKWMEQRERADQKAVAQASYQLATILEHDKKHTFAPNASDNPMLAACRLLGDRLGVDIVLPPRSADAQRYYSVEEIARLSRLSVRQVTLEGNWWKTDAGPLLAFFGEHERPVALLPTAANRYELHDPHQRTALHVSEDIAAALAPVAFMFYRSFPDRALGALDLFTFGMRGSRNDLLAMAGLGMLGGLLSVTIPVAIGIIFDTFIPLGVIDQIVQVALSLGVVAISMALFQVTRSLVILRIETRMEVSLQAALWHRLLNLPTSFFRGYSAGDLTTRALGIGTIKHMISGVVVSAITSVIFSVFSLGLLFFYDIRLALVALGLVAAYLVMVVAATSRQIYHERKVTDLEGTISGTVLQFLTGISKIRAAGAEERAFVRWAEQFSMQRRRAFQSRSITNYLEVFQSAFPLVALIALFLTVGLTSGASYPPGTFIAINAAFTQFMLTLLGAVFLLRGSMAIVPIYERMRPIFQTLPEGDNTRADPGELSGNLEISHVSFRYRADGPLILDDLSLHINPGEFVAIVGSSGSGKSTIFRLLLGFETPDSGTIYYDGQDIDSLNIQAVRRQIGVVLQSHDVQPGNIFSNIVGVSRLTLEDAWEAARMVGLAEDIKQMPMGMHTVIGEGGGTLSGGQRQRLIIARAIVSRPRILLFDEATSALDNKTQQIVSDSLEKLQATRIVVAHRLSTIKGADRIVVIEGGRIVQTGTYDELMNEAGPFRVLAARQLV